MASDPKTVSKSGAFCSFLTCFGFASKPFKKKKNNNNPKKKNGGKKKKFSFKLRWPKIKIWNIIDKKKLLKYDARAAALKASHDIILEATKAHQRKKIDHHASKYITQKPNNVITKGSHNLIKDIHNGPKNEPYCVTCDNKEDHPILKLVKQPSFNNKVTKDSLIGVLMMVAMLIIMSIWGRLCAILCMSALLYCMPLLRRRNNRDRGGVATPNHRHTHDTKSNNNVVDLNSELYKKKVVLEGLLQRDHKNAVGIS